MSKRWVIDASPLILLQKINIMPAASPLIDSLKSAGLRFNEDWISSALKIVGED